MMSFHCLQESSQLFTIARLFGSMAALCMLLGFAVGCSPEADRSVVTGTVRIEIESGDELQIVTMENVSSGTTLETVLRAVQQPQFTIRGRGKTAFVNKIGDQATSRDEGWTFRIDGQWSSEGIGSVKLEPPATVHWAFGSME